MAGTALGRLEKVDLRKQWESEPADFTPWLAEPVNLQLLGETLGIELELESTEHSVGLFSADILCRNTADGSWVLVENQLERTDHIHLGQLLTYAAGLDAVSIVWIAQRFTDEHRSVLDWLNDVTSEGLDFFGIEIELWRIGDSTPAPRFSIVSKPNDWAQTIKTVATSGRNLTETAQAQLRFWTAFRESMMERSDIPCTRPAPQHWMAHPIGRAGCSLQSIAGTSDHRTGDSFPILRVELVIGGQHPKAYFDQLASQKAEMERDFGGGLEWYNPPDIKRPLIYVRSKADFRESEAWPDHHEWLRANLEKFKAVFGPRLRQLEDPVADI